MPYDERVSMLSPVHLQTLLDALAMAGHPARVVLAEAGLSNEVIDPQGPWVPEAWLDRLMRAAIVVTGNPGCGLSFSTSLALTRYGPQALLILQAPTLRHALRDARHFSPLLHERPELSLSEFGGEAWLSLNPLGTTPAGLRFRTEWLMCLVVQMARRAGAQPGDLLSVCFQHPRPDHVDQYVGTFGNTLVFDAPTSGLRFPSALLDQVIPGMDRRVYDGMRVPVEAMLSQRLQRVDVVQTLRATILAALPRLMDVNEAAATVHMSGRSLRRHLSERGLGYAELQQQCQRELAERLLRDVSVPLKGVAEATGFSSPSCFHRAFRRWHGDTPLAWRQQRVG